MSGQYYKYIIFNSSFESNDLVKWGLWDILTFILRRNDSIIRFKKIVEVIQIAGDVPALIVLLI